MEPLLGPLAAFASSLTWAIGVSAYSTLAINNHPAAVNMTRAFVALPLALGFALLTLGGIGPVAHLLSEVPGSKFSWLVVSMFSGYAFGDVLFLISARSIGVPAALAIASCFPFWSAIAGFFVLGESPSGTKLLGLGCTVLGTIIVILSGRKHSGAGLTPHTKAYWVGVFLAVMTSILWAINAYATTVGGRDLPVAITTILRLSIALILCPMVGLIMNRKWTGLVPAPLIKRFLLVFMLEGFGGATLYTYGLGHSSVAVGSALSALSPAMAAPLAWALGSETFSLPKAIGIVTALVGVVLLVLP